MATSTLASASPIQGGFRLFDPENPKGREVGVLSLGPLVVAGARARTGPSAGETGICTEMILVMLGAEGTKRGPTTLRIRQRDDVVVFFVFDQCVSEELICLAGSSQAAAVPGCSGSVMLRTGERISGKVKVKCKNGIAASNPAFALTAQEQAWIAEAFPGLEQKFSMKFREQAGEEVRGKDLEYKIRNLHVHALDDVVGTYLADDELPLCGG